MMEYALDISRWRLTYKGGLLGKLKSAIRLLVDTISDDVSDTQVFGVTEGGLSKEKIAENAGRMLDRYGDSILRLSYSYLHNMSDAEDVVQETLIRYMRTAPSFENEAHEKAWLMRVAANLSKNRIDYNNVRQADELDERLAEEEREDLSFVWDAVKSLPDNYRDVLHLFYHEGYSTKEISDILRRNESTVRSDLRRGRDKLRLVLKEVYDFD